MFGFLNARGELANAGAEKACGAAVIVGNGTE